MSCCAVSCHALIVAAGQGQRFGAALPKQYLPLSDTTVLGVTLRSLSHWGGFASLWGVINRDYAQEAQESAQGLCVTWTAGAADRQASVRAGLEAMAQAGTDEQDLVFIHDAARPLVSGALLSALRDAACQTGAAIPVLPLKDTLKQRVSDGGQVGPSVDRARLWAAQTPQVFRFGAILAAHRQLADTEQPLTDDASLFEVLGMPVAAVPGEETALKITTPLDLKLVQLLV